MMRLLLKKEVNKGKESEEDRLQKRLGLVNKELYEKEKILNTSIDSVSVEKEKIVKEFDRFCKDISDKRTKLNTELVILEERKNVLEIENIRNNAAQFVLDEQEDILIQKRHKLEEDVKETTLELKQKGETLEKTKKEQVEQTRILKDKLLFINEEEQTLKVKKQELKEKEELFEEQKKTKEATIQQQEDELERRKTETTIKKATNDVAKELISKEWENIERTKLKLKDERAILDSAWSELKYKQNA